MLISANHSIATLIDENPDVVLMHVGINDILNMERTKDVGSTDRK